MVWYPQRLLPLDLASIEPCDRYVEVVISPTESDIERNIGKSVDSRLLTKCEDTVQPIDKPTFNEKPVDHLTQIKAPERPLAKAVKASPLVVKGRKQALVHRPVRAVKKGKELKTEIPCTSPFIMATKKRKVDTECPVFNEEWEVTEVIPQIDDSAAQHALEMAERAKKQSLTGAHVDHWASLRKSITSKKGSMQSRKSEGVKSPAVFMILPTEADLAGQILVSMFQKRLEEEERTFENPFMEDEHVGKRSAMLGDHTHRVEVDTVATTSASKSAEISKISSLVDRSIPKPIIEELKATDAASIEETGSDTVEIILAVKQAKTVKIVQSKKTPEAVGITFPKTTRDTPSLGLGETVMTTFVRSKPQKKTTAVVTPKESSTVVTPKRTVKAASRKGSITVASPKETTAVVSPKETTAVVTPKETSTVVTPKGTIKAASPKESIAVASPKDTTEVVTPKETTAIATLKRTVKDSSSKDVDADIFPKRAEIVVSPKESIDTVEGTKKTVKYTKAKATKKGKEITYVQFPEETVRALELIKTKDEHIEFTPLTGKTSTESENVEFSYPTSKKFEELTKGIIQVSSSNRQILKIIHPKRTSSDHDIDDTVKETESPESLPELGEYQLDKERDTMVSSSKSSETSTPRTKTSESVLSESPEISTSSSEYGEPEDILFFEDSSELPIVRTRVYTKKPSVPKKLPPIKSPSRRGTKIRFPDRVNKATIFKRKMTVTLEELLKQRKQIAPETIVQDVKEGDLEQALVLPSFGLKGDTNFKVQRDHIMHDAPDSSSKCLKASFPDPKQTVNTYLYSKGIDELFKYLTTRLIMERPEKPLDYLIDIVRNIREKREVFYRMYREHKGENEDHADSSTCTLK